MADPTGTVIPSGFDSPRTRCLQWFATADDTRLSTKIQLKHPSGQIASRGIVARHEIAEDEELFAVPRPLVLMTATSSIPSSVLEPLTNTGAWSPLIVTIIFEYLQKERSPWHPYFQVLPTTFDTLMFWNEAELAELQASAVVNKIGREEAEESWRETIIPVMLAHPQLFPLPGTTASERTTELIQLAHMAGSLIMVYAFDIDGDDDKVRPVDDDSEEDFENDDEDEPLKGMVPVANMLNADADLNNARLLQEADYLIMRSTKSIAAGDEIFLDYGPLPRSELLRMYGHITDSYAQHDVVEFSHDLLVEVAGKNHDRANKTWLKREQQLDEIGLLDDGYAMPRPPDFAKKLEELIPGQVHMLLRALCASETDDTAMKTPKEAVTVEEAALLQAVIVKRLSEYGTTFESDRSCWEATDRLVPTGCEARRFSMALQVRMGEKLILRQLLTFCQIHIEQKSEEARAGSLKRAHNEGSDGHPKKMARRENHRRNGA